MNTHLTDTVWLLSCCVFLTHCVELTQTDSIPDEYIHFYAQDVSGQEDQDPEFYDEIRQYDDLQVYEHLRVPELVGELAEHLSMDMFDAFHEATAESYVKILFPQEGAVVDNPVTFLFEAGGGVIEVAFFADDWPLQAEPFDASVGHYTYEFTGVNFSRHVVLEGYGKSGSLLAMDQVNFTPVQGYIPPPSGFNKYVIEAINDWAKYPKDGTYPYCWKDCPGSMGMIHNTYYAGQLLWEGENTCFCTGHTLEIFLDAYRRWQQENAVDESVEFGSLTYESVHGGVFYQHWQGYGVASTASAADAFESAGIGYNIYSQDWETVLPGDFVNLSRTNGTGHSVIFISWVKQEDEIAGLRYYGCNNSGDSTPAPDDPTNTAGNSGPSFVTEYFAAYGGKVIPAYLFIGHVLDPSEVY